LILLAAKTVNVGNELLFDYDDHQSSLKYLRSHPVSHICRTLHEYNTMIRYVMSTVIFGHFQRPHVAQNTTTEKFVCAKTTTDSRVIIGQQDWRTCKNAVVGRIRNC